MPVKCSLLSYLCTFAYHIFFVIICDKQKNITEKCSSVFTHTFSYENIWVTIWNKGEDAELWRIYRHSFLSNQAPELDWISCLRQSIFRYASTRNEECPWPLPARGINNGWSVAPPICRLFGGKYSLQNTICFDEASLLKLSPEYLYRLCQYSK